MSTPTSRPPHGEPDDGLTAADRAAMGQHAAPRPTPPPPGAGGAHAGGPAATGVPTGPQTGAATSPQPVTQPAAPQPAAPHATGPQPTQHDVTPSGTTAGTTAAGGAAAGAAGTAATAGRADDDVPTRRRERGAAEDRDLPEPPPRRGAGRHVLGVLVGLLLTPVALLLTSIGTARLADVAGTTDMGTDTLGLTLLVGGLVLLALLVLLGAWSAAVPITGGLVWGLGLGLAYLVVPGVMEDTAEQWLGQDPPAAVEQLAQSAMSGQLVLIGTLLLAAGLAAAAARRSGRRRAEQVAVAEAARAQAVTGERDRIRLEADQRARRT